MMHIRGAAKRDLQRIDELFKQDNFQLDIDHIEFLIVAVDENDTVIAVASLVTFLEASFVTDEAFPIKTRIEALQRVIAMGEAFVIDKGYQCYHAFATNEKIERITKKRFGYIDAIGKNLIKWVK